MDSYQASLHQIAADHHVHIHDHITQAKTAQAGLEQSNREQEQWQQRQVHSIKGADMGL
jgi:hypothetical protein